MAEEHLGVPSLLDADDVANGRTDERSIMTYLAQYPVAFIAHTKVFIGNALLITYNGI